MSDLIRRQDAIDAFYTYPNITWTSLDVLAKINKLPSAERTGHWILSDYQNQEDVENGNYWYICSECSHRDLHAKTQEVPFCWWCGARMKGEEE